MKKSKIMNKTIKKMKSWLKKEEEKKEIMEKRV